VVLGVDELPLGLRLGLDDFALDDLDGLRLLVFAPLFVLQKLPLTPVKVATHAALTSSFQD
jgi:hypothetical protein